MALALPPPLRYVLHGFHTCRNLVESPLQTGKNKGVRLRILTPLFL